MGQSCGQGIALLDAMPHRGFDLLHVLDKRNVQHDGTLISARVKDSLSTGP